MGLIKNVFEHMTSFNSLVKKMTKKNLDKKVEKQKQEEEETFDSFFERIVRQVEEEKDESIEGYNKQITEHPISELELIKLAREFDQVTRKIIKWHGKSEVALRKISNQTNYSSHQIDRLVEVFRENWFPQRPQTKKLAEELGLSRPQIDGWFVNARFYRELYPAENWIKSQGEKSPFPLDTDDLKVFKPLSGIYWSVENKDSLKCDKIASELGVSYWQLEIWLECKRFENKKEKTKWNCFRSQSAK